MLKIGKNFLNNYYGLVYEADSYLEKLYYFFESEGIFETTNILIIADHGDLLSSHGLKQKQLPFNQCSNVPCLIYSPDLVHELVGTSSTLYGSLVDILPTQLILNNLHCNGTNFDGQPLLIWSGCKLIINTKAHFDYNPINIVNSTMYTLNYFFYLQWYNKNYLTQSLTSNPSNMFEFQSSFVSIITKIDNSRYKFGRYYSTFSIIKYQLFKCDEQIIFNKLEYIEYVTKNLYQIFKKSTIQYIEKNYPNIFNFDTGLNVITNDFGNYNVYLYYVYYAFVGNKLNLLNELVYFIPGSMSDWDTNYKLNIFSYFLYNLDNDPSESFNLLDIKNIDYVGRDLKNKLNDTLNISLREKNCYKIKTILPTNTYLQLANLLYVFGGFITNLFEDIQYTILGSLVGTNGLDTKISLDVTNKFNHYINNITNKINYTNILNPFNLYDPINLIYYVGEHNYVDFIHNNFSYFNKFILNKGFPELKDKNFALESNNILPWLNVVKIIQ